MAGLSKYRGVFRHRNKWRSQFYADGKRISLGVYDTEIEAAVAYDMYARRVLGSDAKCNFTAAQMLGMLGGRYPKK